MIAPFGIQRHAVARLPRQLFGMGPRRDHDVPRLQLQPRTLHQNPAIAPGQPVGTVRQDARCFAHRSCQKLHHRAGVGHEDRLGEKGRAALNLRQLRLHLGEGFGGDQIHRNSKGAPTGHIGLRGAKGGPRFIKIEAPAVLQQGSAAILGGKALPAGAGIRQKAGKGGGAAGGGCGPAAAGRLAKAKRASQGKSEGSAARRIESGEDLSNKSEGRLRSTSGVPTGMTA